MPPFSTLNGFTAGGGSMDDELEEPGSVVDVVVAADGEAFDAESSPDSFGERDIRCALIEVRWGKSTSTYREKDLPAA